MQYTDMDDSVFAKNEEETMQLGYDFAKRLHPQDVVFLIGTLGSGKTTFTKGLARGLGVETRVISPTFIVVRMHHITNFKKIDRNPDIKSLYHLDLYRLQTEKEVLGIDLADYLQDKNGVVVIEWPELSQNVVDKKVWKVRFEIVDDMRKITFLHE